MFVRKDRQLILFVGIFDVHPYHRLATNVVCSKEHHPEGPHSLMLFLDFYESNYGVRWQQTGVEPASLRKYFFCMSVKARMTAALSSLFMRDMIEDKKTLTSHVEEKMCFFCFRGCFNLFL